MNDVNATVLRTALALPLAFEAYHLVGFVARADGRPLILLISLGAWLLPATGLFAACILIFIAPRGRRLWYLVAASGAWLVILELYVWHALGLSYPWRPSVEFAVGLYAVLLALAFLLGRLPAGSRRVSPEINGRART